MLNFTWEQAKTCIGTPYYSSPEIIENKPYSFKSDIFSLGILFYELASLKKPFDTNNKYALSNKIKECRVPPLPTSIPREMRELIYSLLKKDPAQRPSTEDILSRLKYVNVL